MDVREIMSSPVRVLDPEDTLNCAAKLMREAAVGCVPIVDGSGALVGILTGALHVRIGQGYIDGAPGALIGAVGVTLAFVVVVLALAVVVAVVYGLGFVFVGLAIFVPIMIAVAIFPVLAPFVLLVLLAFWLVRRARRRSNGAATPTAP